MAENYPRGSQETDLGLTYRHTEEISDGKTVYYVTYKEEILQLLEGQFSERTGAILSGYDGKLNIKDGQYEKGKQRIGAILSGYDGKLNIKDGQYEKGKHYMCLPGKSKSGFSAHVDICIDAKNKDHVFALKKVNVATQNEKVIKSVLRETRALCKLEHENIVKLCGMIVDCNKICILMEYGGCPINEAIANMSQKPKPITLLHWFLQFFSAMSFMHCNEYVHCDLHCGNILLMSDSHTDNTLKLCDLGSTKRFGEDLFTISHGYTVWYFPPTVLRKYLQRKAQVRLTNKPVDQDEILHGLQIKVSARLDMYAAGKILLEMVMDRVKSPIKIDELSEVIKTKEGWDNCIAKTIPDGCDKSIKYLIINLMTFNTSVIFNTAKSVIDYIEVNLKVRKTKYRIIPLPGQPSNIQERDQEERMEVG